MSIIAFFHNALGKTDGVSLEVDKWRFVLEKMGHKVLYCAGNSDVNGVYCIPELSFEHPLTNKILVNGTIKLQDYLTEEELITDINYQAEILQEKLLDFINTNNVEILIPNNLLSVGYNIPAVIALSKVIEETGLPTVCHNHDFYFEDSGEVTPTCSVVKEIFEKFIPPSYKNVKNMVINRLAQKALRLKKGLNSRVVPNVFDFEQPLWEFDEYNSDFRADIGVGENDLVFLQATRILDRKGVELAIDVVAELNKPYNLTKLYGKKMYDGKIFNPGNRIILVCSGYVEKFGISNDYSGSLIKKAIEKDVEVKFVGEIVKHSRSKKDGKKVYSLWDSYVHADFVTYPSVWEGWGNQFIEAIFAKLPVVLFEYPVYISDLKETGFEVVSLGDEIEGKDKYGLVTVPDKNIRAAAEDIIGILTNHELRRKMTERNFKIAKDYFAYEALEKIINEIF